jgi:Domain of unknown function (DUF4159)
MIRKSCLGVWSALMLSLAGELVAQTQPSDTLPSGYVPPNIRVLRSQAQAITTPAQTDPRGGHVQWARLKSQYQWWSRHGEMESRLINFVRQHTSLGIDPAWAVADLYDEKSIWAYPLLYAEAIHPVTDKQGQQKLREYILRGGFVLIDGCINPQVNPDPDVFFQSEVQTFREFLPEAKIRPIAADDEIYHCFFELKRLPHHYMQGVYDERWAKYPLHAVEHEGRIVSIISLSGLKCGAAWGEQISPELPGECIQMLVNIYVYALTH